jgi:hypothetical protein
MTRYQITRHSIFTDRLRKLRTEIILFFLLADSPALPGYIVSSLEATVRIQSRQADLLYSSATIIHSYLELLIIHFTSSFCLHTGSY